MSCREVLEALEAGLAGPEVWEHVASCSRCGAHERLLALLARLSPAPVPSEAFPTEGLPHPRWVFRLPATYLPLVLGLVFLAAGLLGLQVERGWPAAEETRRLLEALAETTGFALSEGVAQVLAGVVSQRAGWVAGWALVAMAVGGLSLLRWLRRRTV